jgi:adenylate cyclase
MVWNFSFGNISATTFSDFSFYFCQSAEIFSKNYLNIQKYCSVFYPWFGISVSEIFHPLLKSLQFNEFQ